MAHRNPADEWDQPAEPEPTFSSDCEAWESECIKSKTLRHKPAHKLADRWLCVYCHRWLKLPKGRT